MFSTNNSEFMHFCEQKLSCRCAQPSSNEFDKSVHIIKRFCKQNCINLLINNLKTIFHQFGSLSRLPAGDDARGLVIFHQFGSLSRLPAGDDARELVIFHQFGSLSRLQAGDDARGLVIRLRSMGSLDKGKMEAVTRPTG